MRKNKCCNLSSEKWIDYNTKRPSEATEIYIIDQIKRVIEIINIPGIYDKREDPDEEMKRISTLATGLPGLARLKEHSLAQLKEINQIRGFFSDFIPFKLGDCYTSLPCCGECIRHCQYRCVQDILHKISVKASVIYLGIVPYDKAPADARACYKAITSLNSNYVTLNAIVDELNAEKEEGITYDYAPFVDKVGNKYNNYDKETGEVLFTNWPDDGMCPYCVPPTTIITRYSQRNAKRSRGTRVKEEYKYKEDFKLDGKRRVGRPRKG